MGATLGLRASPTACRTGGQLSSPKSAGTQVQLGRRSCFNFRAWDSRSAVLCEYTIWQNWFPVVGTVCTQYTLLAQAKLVLSSSAVLRIAYSAQYTQTGSSTLAQDKYNLPRQGKGNETSQFLDLFRRTLIVACCHKVQSYD